MSEAARMRVRASLYTKIVRSCPDRVTLSSDIARVPGHSQGTYLIQQRESIVERRVEVRVIDVTGVATVDRKRWCREVVSGRAGWLVRTYCSSWVSDKKRASVALIDALTAAVYTYL